jgi:hypothetical protein
MYMLGKDLAFMHQWVLGPLVFALVFHSVTVPRCTLWEMCVVYVCVFEGTSRLASYR